MRNHSITIRGHATSVSMEDQFWASLKMMAKSKNVSIAGLVTQIDADRLDDQNLSSALRLAVLEWWQMRHAELSEELQANSGSEPGERRLIGEGGSLN